jgi:transposase
MFLSYERSLQPDLVVEGMFVVEVYAAVRQFVFNDGKSRRKAARIFGLSRETVSKMCRFSMPPGYVRQRLAAKPKLGPLIPVIRTSPPWTCSLFQLSVSTCSMP